MNETSQLLKAFHATNTRVPVWLMRQAGRFLPQYQAIKKTRSLDEMFRTPQIAAQVTLLPVELLNVDAAILFADILTLPAAMGIKIEFVDGKGPVVSNPIASAADVGRLHAMDGLDYVTETIRLVKAKLPAHTAFIGFAGAPFTVANYILTGRTATGLAPAARFAFEQPKAFEALMRKITRNTIAYLNLQKKAGIDVFQLFDTWGGVWNAKDYRRLILPYIQEIFRAIDLPSIYYLKNCSHLLAEMHKAGSDFLSVCETVTIGSDPFLNESRKGIQGNLYNGLLYADEDTLRREVQAVLTAARRHHKKYIFNLNHGIFPDVSLEKVKSVIEQVHRFSWS